jgi:tetratricopeptide (TPR) repeat protein
VEHSTPPLDLCLRQNHDPRPLRHRGVEARQHTGGGIAANTCVPRPSRRKIRREPQVLHPGSPGKLDDAMRASDGAREIDPAFAAGYNSQANVLRLEKKYDEALAAAHRAIELNPDRRLGTRAPGTGPQGHGQRSSRDRCF